MPINSNNSTPRAINTVELLIKALALQLKQFEVFHAVRVPKPEMYSPLAPIDDRLKATAFAVSQPVEKSRFV